MVQPLPQKSYTLVGKIIKELDFQPQYEKYKKPGTLLGEGHSRCFLNMFEKVQIWRRVNNSVENKGYLGAICPVALGLNKVS